MWHRLGPLPKQKVKYFRWFWVFFGWFGPLMWSGSHFLIRKPYLEDWNPYLRSFDEDRVVGYHNCCSESAVWMILSDFEHFSANSSHYCGRAATLWSGNALLSPKNRTQGRLTKTTWLNINMTAIRSPAEAENEIFWAIFGFFGWFGPLLWSGSHFVDWQTPLEA